MPSDQKLYSKEEVCFDIVFWKFCLCKIAELLKYQHVKLEVHTLTSFIPSNLPPCQTWSFICLTLSYLFGHVLLLTLGIWVVCVVIAVSLLRYTCLLSNAVHNCWHCLSDFQTLLFSFWCSVVVSCMILLQCLLIGCMLAEMLDLCWLCATHISVLNRHLEVFIWVKGMESTVEKYTI